MRSLESQAHRLSTSGAGSRTQSVRDREQWLQGLAASTDTQDALAKLGVFGGGAGSQNNVGDDVRMLVSLTRETNALLAAEAEQALEPEWSV